MGRGKRSGRGIKAEEGIRSNPACFIVVFLCLPIQPFQSKTRSSLGSLRVCCSCTDLCETDKRNRHNTGSQWNVRMLNLAVVPGKSVGPFILGAPIASVLSLLRTNRDIARVEVKYDESNPLG